MSAVPRPVARVARFIAHQCDWASVATVSSRPPVVGQPFSNTLSVSDGPRGSGSGSPYLYLTRMEASVQDLQVNPAASLSMTLAQTDYCRQQGFDPQSPLCARLILSGSVLQVNGTEAEFAKKSLFSRHPEMIDWPTDHDWFFAKAAPHHFLLHSDSRRHKTTASARCHVVEASGDMKSWTFGLMVVASTFPTAEAMALYDPKLCFLLDGFLVVYGLVITGMFIKEKVSDADFI
ncbi:Pyrid oxidase 2 multi-domain protein isoform 4 [Scophthalmus maximus]|uniref:Pyrid oxidase 2 multi-domain protein n=1 Tax=Scophthalmus maximus TaxID=52904 RepID=A0A2U9AV87_SCOMX|nr:Pyrid oxidase 2 multi-domain protein [Scophthalmus maximus]AWO95498.1 Pyrid oxidase 2 multi-domain protein isoform 2 [Scophthalmus maximus]AWO95500.1 Pyrid oxidase 2 multi-domain protein isoform 4 [Scophthalmus maximus]